MGLTREELERIQDAQMKAIGPLPYEVHTRKELELLWHEESPIQNTQMEENKMEQNTSVQNAQPQTNELAIGVGTKEAVKLSAAVVKVLRVELKQPKADGGKILECFCKHPQKEEEIKISKVKFENKGKLETVGLWINKDEEGLLRKGSALALLIQKLGVANAEQLVGKDIETTLDENHYLAFKNY